VARIESGEIDRPQRDLLASLQGSGRRSPLTARCLAVLSATPEEAWGYFQQAWNVTRAVPPAGEAAEVTGRFTRNLSDEMLSFLIGNLKGATTATPNTLSPWYIRLSHFHAEASAAVDELQAGVSDTMQVAGVMLDAGEKRFGPGLGVLREGCFPTLGRGRDVLISLWQGMVVANQSEAQGRCLSAVEAHQARRAMPVPRNIGCPYATLYCEQYW